MSKRCIAVDDLASPHDYKPGTTKQHNDLYFNGYMICGQKRGHFLHKGACAMGCDRTVKGDAEFCCRRCEVGMSEHTDKCDERYDNRDRDDD